MKRQPLHLLIFASSVSTLTACGSSGDSTPPPPPPITVTAQEDAFGIEFGKAFRTTPDGTPSEPKDGDIIPVSLNADPIEIK